MNYPEKFSVYVKQIKKASGASEITLKNISYRVYDDFDFEVKRFAKDADAVSVEYVDDSTNTKYTAVFIDGKLSTILLVGKIENPYIESLNKLYDTLYFGMGREDVEDFLDNLEGCKYNASHGMTIMAFTLGNYVIELTFKDGLKLSSISVYLCP